MHHILEPSLPVVHSTFPPVSPDISLSISTCFEDQDICDTKFDENANSAYFWKIQFLLPSHWFVRNNMACEVVTMTHEMLVLLTTSSNYALCV